MRIRCNERGDRTTRRRLRIEHDDGRLRTRELRAVPWIREKRYGASMRRRQRCDAVDAHIRIATKLAAESDCELPERKGHEGTGRAECEARYALKPYLGAGFGALPPGAAGAPAAGFGARDCSDARIAGVMSSAGTE